MRERESAKIYDVGSKISSDFQLSTGYQLNKLHSRREKDDRNMP